MGVYYAWFPVGRAAYVDSDDVHHPGWGEYEYAPAKLSVEQAEPFKDDLLLDIVSLSYGVPTGSTSHQVITFAGESYKDAFQSPDTTEGWAAYRESNAAYPGEHLENIDIEGYVYSYDRAADIKGLLVVYTASREVGTVVPGAPYTDSPRMWLLQHGSDIDDAEVTLHIDSNYTTPYLGLESFKVYATFHTPGRDTPPFEPPPEPVCFWMNLVNAKEIV